MYQPDHYRVADLSQLHALMRARPFATLVSNGTLGLYASHLPTVLKDEPSNGMIECHLSRANPHWKDLATGNEALMIFQGPDAYVTPDADGRATQTSRCAVTDLVSAYPGLLPPNPYQPMPAGDACLRSVAQARPGRTAAQVSWSRATEARSSQS